MQACSSQQAVVRLYAVMTTKICEIALQKTITPMKSTINPKHELAKNYKTAAYWYAKAAKIGNLDAQYMLAVCYNNGTGLRQSFRMAFRWFAKAASKGYAAAQCRLGYYYMTGQYVKKNTKKALKWLSQASKQGYIEACFFINDIRCKEKQKQKD